MTVRAQTLRALPSVDALLRDHDLVKVADGLPRALLVEAVRAELGEARARLKRGAGPGPKASDLVTRAVARARTALAPQLARVLNATGVVLHTNLGRAPLSEAARAAVAEVASGYSSLELDLATGKRGDRGVGVERWLTRLTGAEAALAVNNGAAAILLALSALSQGRRVLVSRGELVEIGGSFRVPDVMEKSGAVLLEVGTTNRTHLRDYEKALARHSDVAAILRVHPSNFRIAGFTARPKLAELVAVAHRHRVPVIEDLGSGALIDLGSFGIEREPTVRESLTAGSDVVTFSGDKLLGASQAGLVLGRKRWVDRIRRDPLARALRLDKLALAALEATLPAYLDPARAAREIPALAMLITPLQTLERRCLGIVEILKAQAPDLRATVEQATGEVGGGALPLVRLPGWVVALEDPERSAVALEALARGATPPVIGYVREGKLRLDVRTLDDHEADAAARALAHARGAQTGRE